ncbi:signaling protein [Clostridioides difficile]|uniref:putative bifunctional diguanylate cyclase/phosphodiesterase n=1 Tax=Clostridioides difficile TaxID=1496 RepID=UPI0003B29EA1|nr:GGDEF domain-containing phosphodiesterase [Clostridioides difficile]MCE0688548.1 GGDEF domain-containing phosphodiesterase [Clostridioides difficile]MCE0713172.1 GGDEF domain-containing phosphodiesterase [Clostridioides difficile]MCE0720477.1 GGDEF domain-containing phosphodiesterase [Clostridioides difficile]MCE0729933.1 GGDEF domain-containing phosphodiesterase [Clostridioides difficile]QPK99944.1 signaling protein [Clostridioides difficile]
MKRFLRRIILVLFILLIFISFISIKLIHNVGDYGKLINYVGIVRGASQRLTKLEMNHKPNDELIEYIDEILQELITGHGNYGLVLTDCNKYNEDLLLLEKKWEDLNSEIKKVRMKEPNNQLLSISEEFFSLANDTVFEIENFSKEKSNYLMTLIIIISIIGILACIILILQYSKKMIKLEKLNVDLKNIAYKDELTGVNTIEKFKLDANQNICMHKDKKFAVFYIDFENFKYINDIFGYDYGDMILKRYANLMMNDIGKYEIFAREIADRFVALRCYIDKEDLVVRQRIVDSELINTTNEIKNKHSITVVSGICCIEDVNEKLSIDGLINRANFAQKTVKNKPGTNYAFYNDSIRKKMIEENTIKSRIHEAIEKREFIVYLQPKVNLHNQKINCAEALVRWLTPDKGIISPAIFIPVLEKNFFIALVDKYVFEEVCKWIRKRLDENKPFVQISVNVSRIQFYNTKFVETYSNIQNKYRIPKNTIEIEFTESVAFENQNHLLKIIHDLHENGFTCSLDDFGKGYSSLSVLKDLPFDALKLDSMFFKASLDKDKEKIVIKNIVHMLKELNITTVAEGIEYEEQVEFLRDIGCDLVQGFVFYKPMPILEFEEILDKEFVYNS